jgi:type I restriction enzyme S subunit
MSNSDRKAIVPELRFPDFTKSGSWQIKQLIDVTDKDVKWSFIGGPFGSNLKSSDYVKNGIRIIQLQNIGDGQFFNKYKIYTSKDKADELLSNNIYPGNIILSKMGDPVGRACLIPLFHDRYVMCSDGIRLVVDEKKNSKYFIYSLINSAPFRSLIEKSATGSTRKRIGLDNLKKLPMFVPMVRDEQQKIADCLASIDDLIKAHTKKLDTLNDHKKGLMQQLFPTEGETVPKFRFSNFKEQWQKITIGSIGKVSMCKRILKHETRPSGDIPFYKIGTFGKQADAYINREVFNIYKEKYSYPKVGDILISAAGTIGRLVVFDGKDAYFQDSNIVWLDNNESLIRNDFLLYCYENTKWQTDDNTIARLYNDNLRGIEILIPTDEKKEEQKKIVDLLAEIDNIIITQTQKVESLKAHKKGLMQKLFPSVNEEEYHA